MVECDKCKSKDLINYYTKPDGEFIIEYWRCNSCLEIFEIKRTR
jgi:hypothetical protein